MTATELLAKVKSNLGITGTYQDTTIQGWINETKQFLLEGGVDEGITNSEIAVGVITRGVADLWNYGSGNGSLSNYFYQRATQLVLKSTGETPEEIAKLNKRVTDLERRVDEHDELFEELAGENDD